jgi:hypothetical protein
MTDPIAPNEPRQPTARFVLPMIVVTVLLFLIAVGVLGFQWLRTTEPNSELLIIGNEALNGAQASVRGVEESNPFTSTFGSGGRYALPFYLYPGAYLIRVTSKDGDVIEDREVNVRAKERLIVDLTKWERKIPTSAPAPSPTVFGDSTTIAAPSTREFAP